MSKLSDLRTRTRTLREIRSILNAMKNLSLAELNKISRFQEAQEEMARFVEEALDDVENFFDLSSFRPAPHRQRLYVLLGSERGFCGDFNETVLSRYERERASESGPSMVLAVGRKLGMRLGGIPGLIGVLDGPGTAEEIPGIIASLVFRLTPYSRLDWMFIHHLGGESKEQTLVLHPFAKKEGPATHANAYPPLMTLAPEDLFSGLLEHYLFSVLYRAFYLSFLVENRQRFQHMDGALDFLEKNLEELEKRSNILRQEEITEEIEIILLGILGKGSLSQGS